MRVDAAVTHVLHFGDAGLADLFRCRLVAGHAQHPAVGQRAVTAKPSLKDMMVLRAAVRQLRVAFLALALRSLIGRALRRAAEFKTAHGLNRSA